MNTVTIFLWLAIGTFASVNAVTASTRADELADVAIEAMKAGRFQEASTYLERITRADPRYQRGHYLLCMSYHASERYREALSACTQAIRIDPYNQNVSRVYARRGTSFYRLGRYDSAIKDFNRAIELDPVDWKSVANRAEAWYAKGDSVIAQWDLEKAIELNPDEPRLRSRLAEVRSGKAARQELRRENAGMPTEQPKGSRAQPVAQAVPKQTHAWSLRKDAAERAADVQVPPRQDDLEGFDAAPSVRPSGPAGRASIKLDDSRRAICESHRNQCLSNLPEEDRDDWRAQNSCYVFDPYKYIDVTTGEVKSKGLPHTFYLLADMDYCSCLKQLIDDGHSIWPGPDNRCYQQACDIACRNKGYSSGFSSSASHTIIHRGKGSLRDTLCARFPDGRTGARLGSRSEYSWCLCSPCPPLAAVEAKSEETLFGHTFDGPPTSPTEELTPLEIDQLDALD